MIAQILLRLLFVSGLLLSATSVTLAMASCLSFWLWPNTKSLTTRLGNICGILVLFLVTTLFYFALLWVKQFFPEWVLAILHSPLFFLALLLVTTAAEVILVVTYIVTDDSRIERTAILAAFGIGLIWSDLLSRVIAALPTI